MGNENKTIGPSVSNGEVVISVASKNEKVLRALLTNLGVKSVSSSYTNGSAGSELSVGLDANELESKLAELVEKLQRK